MSAAAPSSSPTTTWACAASRCCSRTASTCALVVTHRDDPERERSGSRAWSSLRARHGLEVATPRRPATRPEFVARVRGARAGLPLLLLLPPHALAARLLARRRARRLQHARLAAAEVPRARPGELGRPARRARDRGHAARDGGEARRGAHRRPAWRCRSCPTTARSTSSRKVTGGRRAGARPRAAAPHRRHRARSRRRTSPRGGYFGGAPPEDGRIDWSRARAADPRPRARRGPALSGRLHDARRRGACGVLRTRVLADAAGRAPPRAWRVEGGERLRGPVRRRRRARASSKPTSTARTCRRRGVRWRASARDRVPLGDATMKKLCILGVNGFIGHHLSQRILADTDWEVFGMDMGSDRIARPAAATRASTSSRATSRSTRSGSSTTSASAT